LRAKKRNSMTSSTRNPSLTTGKPLTMATVPSDRTIVFYLLHSAVHERADEISGLWAQDGHAVQVAASPTTA
jgi:hypothetical protein